MDGIVSALKTDIDDFCVLNNKLLGFPKPPTSHIGGGKHVIVDTENPGYGWTLNYCESFQHPSNGNWAHEVDQVMIDASTDPQYTQNLTAGELVTYQATIATRQALTSDWFPEV